MKYIRKYALFVGIKFLLVFFFGLNTTEKSNAQSYIFISPLVTTPRPVYTTQAHEDSLIALAKTVFPVILYTKGSILYTGTAGIVRQSNSQLFWDSTAVCLGIGTNTVSTGNALVINKTFTDGNTSQNAISLTGNSTISTGFSQIRGMLCTVKNSGTTGTTGVVSGALFSIQGNGSQNYLTNNFTGISIGMSTLAGQSGTMVDVNSIRINAPSFAGAKPTSNYGLHVFNQGVSGVTTSIGLLVDAQSGSTNPYAAIFAGGNVAVGNSAPTQEFEVTGDITIVGGFLYMQDSVHLFTITKAQ